MVLRGWHLRPRWLCGQKLEEETSEDIRLVLAQELWRRGCPPLLRAVASRAHLCCCCRCVRGSLSHGLRCSGAWLCGLHHISYRKQGCRPIFGVRESWVYVLIRCIFGLCKDTVSLSLQCPHLENGSNLPLRMVVRKNKLLRGSHCVLPKSHQLAGSLTCGHSVHPCRIGNVCKEPNPRPGM